MSRSYINSGKDLGSQSAFGEQLVAQYNPMASWSFHYNVNTYLYTTAVTGNGSVTHDPNASAVLLQTGVTAGTATLKTRQILRYQPGIGGRVRFTATFTEGVANTTQFIGLGDTVDSLGFGYSGSQFGIFRKAFNTTHFTPSTLFSEQSSYTEMEHDPAKLNVYQVQFQWLGGGEIRYYIEDSVVGGFVLVHTDRIANTYTVPSLSDPTFSIMAAVTNTGSATSVALRSSSASAGLEGPEDVPCSQPYFAVDGEKTLTATEVPILTLQNKVEYASVQNRSAMSVRFVTLACEGQKTIKFRFYVNSDLTGETYTDVSTDQTPGAFDVAATAFTGGTKIATIPVSPNSSQTVNVVPFRFRIFPGDTLTVTGQLTATAAGVIGSVGITFASEF